MFLALHASYQIEMLHLRLPPRAYWFILFLSNSFSTNQLSARPPSHYSPFFSAMPFHTANPPPSTPALPPQFPPLLFLLSALAIATAAIDPQPPALPLPLPLPLHHALPLHVTAPASSTCRLLGLAPNPVHCAPVSASFSRHFSSNALQAAPCLSNATMAVW